MVGAGWVLEAFRRSLAFRDSNPILAYRPAEQNMGLVSRYA